MAAPPHPRGPVFPALRPRERPAEEVPPGALRRPAVRLAGRGRAEPPGAPEPYYDLVAGRFTSPGWQPDLRWGFDSACNWKFPIENTLESYHIPCLHPTPSAGSTRASRPRSTRSTTGIRPCLRLGRGPQAPLLARDDHPSARRRIDERLHPLPYPSQPRLRAHGPVLLRGLVPAHVLGLDAASPAELSLPRPAARAGPGAALAVRGSHRPVDDAPGDVGRHRHLRRPAEGDGGQPTPRCIGTREERIFVFQQYILRECADPRDDGRPLPGEHRTHGCCPCRLP